MNDKKTNDKTPMGIMLDENRILALDSQGNFVEATRENGFYVRNFHVELGHVDENGNVIPEENDDYSKQYAENVAIRTEGKDFVFAMTDGIQRFAPELKFETLTKLVMLSTYAEFTKSDQDSMLIMGNKFAQKHPMTTSDIQRELKLSNSTFYDFMSDVLPQVDENGELLNTPYLYKIDDKYFLNRKYFLRSYLPKGSHSHINKIFVEPVRRLYQIAMVSQHRKLGMVFALLPYINREWNIVCRNPIEDNPALVEALTMKEICEVLNLDKKNSARTINGMIRQVMKVTLKIDGVKQFFCGLFETDEGPEMVINPNFIYIGTRKKEVSKDGARFVLSEDREKYCEKKDGKLITFKDHDRQ